MTFVRHWLDSLLRKLSTYSYMGHDQDTETLVGVDARGVVHALAWRLDQAAGKVEGRCGASITLCTRGTVDCMTCFVKDTR